MSRIVEVYTGAYASGKSEIAINRSLALRNEGTPTIVDLDTVEPAYTLRPIIKELSDLGLKVIAQDKAFGFGEAGNVINAEQQNCLLQPNNTIIDVGYGVGGLDILELINGIENEQNLSINLVLNTSKFETSNVDSILEYVDWYSAKKTGWKRITGIIANPHFGDETTFEDIKNGLEIVKEAAAKMELPIIAIGMAEKLAPPSQIDNIPVWSLKRFMPRTMWESASINTWQSNL